MQSPESPFYEDFGRSNEQARNVDKLDDIYAEKALARLDEMFKQQEQVAHHSDDVERATRAEEKAKEEVSRGDYEDRLHKHLSHYEDPGAKTQEELNEDEREAFNEIVKSLHDLGIEPSAEVFGTALDASEESEEGKKETIDEILKTLQASNIEPLDEDYPEFT